MMTTFVFMPNYMSVFKVTRSILSDYIYVYIYA